MPEETKEKQAILSFDDKKYDINSLEEETKKVLTGLRVSDAQIKFYEDTLRVLVTGRTSLVNDLKAKLKDVEPIKEKCDDYPDKGCDDCPQKENKLDESLKSSLENADPWLQNKIDSVNEVVEPESEPKISNVEECKQ